MTITIMLDDTERAYEPGTSIGGTVSWSQQQAPAWVEVRLYWYTSGKGTQDVGVHAIERFTNLNASDERRFVFPAPAQPLSCSGQLVSITWAIEVLCENDHYVPSVDIIIGPERREIQLHRHTQS